MRPLKCHFSPGARKPGPLTASAHGFRKIRARSWSRRARALRRAAWLAAVFAARVRGALALRRGPGARRCTRRSRPGTRMAQRYDDAAVDILAGEGILWPRVRDKERTGLLARPPGYALYLAVVYATLGHSFFAAQLVQNLLTSLRLRAAGAGGGAARVLADRRRGGRDRRALAPARLRLGARAARRALGRTAAARAASSWRAPIPTASAGCVDERPRRRARRRGRLAAPERGAAAALPLARDPGRGARPPARPACTRVALSLAAVAGRASRSRSATTSCSRLRAGLDQRRADAVAGRRPTPAARELGAKRHDTLVAEEEVDPLRQPPLPRLVGRAGRDLRATRTATGARCEVIRANPARIAGVMLGRMGEMLNYAAGEAPAVLRAAPPLPPRVRPADASRGAPTPGSRPAERSRPLRPPLACAPAAAQPRAAAARRPRAWSWPGTTGVARRCC